MKKFIRNPTTSDSNIQWLRLYYKALKASTSVDKDDPRRKMLEQGLKDPEKVLRRLSIMSDVDIEREFTKGS